MSEREAILNTTNLNNWHELESAVEDIRRNNDAQISPTGIIRRLLFRGQANANWDLKSTLEREKGVMSFLEYYRIMLVIQPQLEAFTHSTWQLPGFGEIEAAVQKYDFTWVSSPLKTSIYGYMAYLRHHGFPSPLLDWTASLQIATFFAFATAKEVARVAIYVLSEARMTSGASGTPEIIPFGPTVRTHRRHFLQQCEYTACMIYDNSNSWAFSGYEVAFETWSKSGNPPVNFEVQCFTLPISERTHILEMLDRSNVNAFSLFGSEESLMSTLSLREFTFPNPYF